MLHNILYLVPCFCCLFWITTLSFEWKRNGRALKAGIGAFLFMAVASFIRFLFLQESDVTQYSPFWDIVEVFCVFGFLSCLALLIRALSHGDRLGWKDFGVFLPGLLFSVLCLTVYLWIGRQEMAILIRDTVHSYEEKVYPDSLSRLYGVLYIYIYKVLVLLFVNGLLVYGWRIMTRHRFVFRFLLTTLFFALFLLTWDYLVFLKIYILIAFNMCLWGAALYYLGYQLLQIKNAAESPADDTVQSGAGDSEIEAWLRIKEKLHPAFTRLIGEEQVFLQPHLRLDELALKANTNRTYLSRLLNEEYGCGFSEFMARKRIEYACELIQNDRELSLEQVAAKSGFLHGATFSRTIKQYTGMTFREWQRKDD